MRRILGPAHDLGKERVRDVGHEHADGLRLLFREPAREVIGLVAERLDGRFDAGLEARAHVRRAVHDRGDSGDRHVGVACHVVDVRRATAL